MKLPVFLTCTLVALTLGGCERDNSLARPQWIPRADLDLTPVPPPLGRGPSAPRDVGPSSATRPWEETDLGTYTFTTPDTVTTIKNNVGEIAQYKLYLGQPQPTDLPVVAIAIAPRVESEAASGTGDLKAEKNRTYLLNGLRCEEWTGKTAAGLPFCELIVSHGEKGDKLHAIAIARDAETRKTALDILGSITWTPKK